MRRLSGYGPSLIVLATAMLVLFLGPMAVRQLSFKHTEAQIVQARHRLDDSNILAQINAAYRDIATFVEPSVVHISAQQTGWNGPGVPSLSSGSGWVYDAAGHVVTNYHVVRQADRIDVQLASGEPREASIVGFDSSTDIAVLKIDAGQLHPATRGDLGDPVQQGDLVFAFGSPFDFRFSMSSGVVSGKGRSLDVFPSGYENFIQVDAAINPGNSGGPLTDFRGRVIGMNTAIATGTARPGLEEGQFAGIGLAIPLEMIEPVVSQLINNDGIVEKGLLGVRPQFVDSRARERGFRGSGVRIDRVEPGLPADLAGVRRHDIVTHINGVSVRTPSQLRSMVSSMLPGETAMLSVWRGPANNKAGPGEELELEVRLVRLDPLRHRGALPKNQPEDQILQLGIARHHDATPDLADRFGVEYRAGVIIERLVPDTNLAKQLEPGSIIIEVAGYPVTSVKDFYAALRRSDLLRPVPMSVILPDGRQERVRISSINP